MGAENGGASNFLTGTLDEVKLYDYALSQDEVNVEYNQGKGQVFGSLSTDADGSTASNSASRAYCPPGDSSGNCATGSDASPVLEWNFDDNSGTSTNDTSGSSLTGTLTNGPIWRPGKISGGIKFDGVDDFVETTSTNLNIAPTITMEAWLRIESYSGSGTHFFIDRSNTNAGYNLGFHETSHNLRLNAGNGTAYTELVGTATLSTGVWYHVVGVISGNNQSIYINGILDATGTFTGPLVTSTGENFHAGARVAATAANATLDQVRIYNYARTGAQIAWDYNKGGPSGWWRMDECTGATAYDASGNGNNATITASTGSNTATGSCNSTNTNEMWNDGSTGKFGASLGFDGTNDVANTASVAMFAGNGLSISNVSFGAWVKPSSFAATNAVLQKSNEIRLNITTSGFPTCEIYSGGLYRGPATSTVAIGSTQWSHVMCTFDGSTITVYVNGTSTGTSSFAGAMTGSSANAFYIGEDSSTGTTFFTGLIDDVRLYNYTLTSAQIKALYNGGSAVSFQ